MNSSCADTLLQLLVAAHLVPKKYAEETPAGMDRRRDVSKRVREYLNKQTNLYFHTTLTDSTGHVGNATEEEHENAPFEHTRHAEGIVRYLLKKFGSQPSVPTVGMMLQVFTRLDAQNNDPTQRSISSGRANGATDPAYILRLYTATGLRFRGMYTIQFLRTTITRLLRRPIQTGCHRTILLWGPQGL